ncbi:GGDEF domain-containing protein [Lysinibacillus sp. PLM2]|nr:GGDEF domain-containing protein [Lysinibacillus sp. PLM2]
MANLPLDTIEQYLQEIIKLNPFDAVVIVKNREDEYTVEMLNDKAKKLSENLFKKGQLAHSFFNFIDWHQLMELIRSPKNEIEYMMINRSNVLCAIYVQRIEFADELYYTIILRNVSEHIEESFEQNKENEKHLYFVEHHIDPIVSLNLNGEIIYTNHAATRKLLEAKSTLVGENIFDILAEEYQKPFRSLFKNTLKGITMGMPKVMLNSNMACEKPFNIRTFPTYWNNQVIGIHIVLKSVDDFFIEDGSPYQLINDHDQLTGLLNRKALNEQWADEFSTFKDGLNIALLLVDLDRFKKYNESLGKDAADKMLKMVSQRLAKLRNKFSELYRYNGDEFVFVLRYFSRDEIEVFANNILAAFKDPFIIDDQEYFLTSSIGISISTYGHNNDLESILHQAEQAVYYVKKNGRFHYRFYRSEMSQAFPNEVLMEAHLRRAIEFDELSIHLQPQIDLQTNEIDSFEALIRWNNRKFGYVPPSQFIPLAESSGLIIQVGDWVLEQVCKNLQEWKLKGYRPVRVAVNISPKQFKQENFATKIEQLLNIYDIEPKYLELEITESSMVNVSETHEILTKLKQLGVYVSVDDFGTGYSSLSYLKKYPIDIIKIDQSFIADINKDEKNEAIIKAIITLSENLGMDVVAEGVEEEFQEEFLKSNNCRKGQGYLYNKPLPVDLIIKEYLVN